MKRLYLLLLVSGTCLFLISCGSNSDQAAGAVEDYLAALTNKEAERLATLSCADWEAEAERELDSLIAVDAELDGVACRVTGTDGDNTLVSCSGSIVLSYNDENQSLPLEERTYITVQEGGEWLVCGFE